jgi:putative ABC transport system ATP-binding protein
MVTHDPRILDVADRLVRMEDGRLFRGEAVSHSVG